MFVAKLNASCTALVFGTYLGGSNEEITGTKTGLSIGAGVAIDAADNIYVAADTLSADFPVQSALQPTLRGSSDGFVTKFSPQGAFIYSTFLGGGAEDGCLGIAVDRAFNVYVTGGTLLTDFPTVNPLQAALAGQIDAFVTILEPTGSVLVFSTYLRGGGRWFWKCDRHGHSRQRLCNRHKLLDQFPEYKYEDRQAAHLLYSEDFYSRAHAGRTVLARGRS